MKLINIFLIILVVLVMGCAESTFMLSNNSRLPIWFEIPEDEKPKDYTVALTYYVWPNGREAIFELKKKNSLWTTKKISGKQLGLHPIILKNSKDAHSPAYEVVTINNVTDIVEHKKMEPIFYMSDDPMVWKELQIIKPKFKEN